MNLTLHDLFDTGVKRNTDVISWQITEAIMNYSDSFYPVFERFLMVTVLRDFMDKNNWDSTYYNTKIDDDLMAKALILMRNELEIDDET
jgi:hypothetical protein